MILLVSLIVDMAIIGLLQDLTVIRPTVSILAQAGSAQITTMIIFNVILDIQYAV